MEKALYGVGLNAKTNTKEQNEINTFLWHVLETIKQIKGYSQITENFISISSHF